MTNKRRSLPSCGTCKNARASLQSTFRVSYVYTRIFLTLSQLPPAFFPRIMQVYLRPRTQGNGSIPSVYRLIKNPDQHDRRETVPILSTTALPAWWDPPPYTDRHAISPHTEYFSNTRMHLLKRVVFEISGLARITDGDKYQAIAVQRWALSFNVGAAWSLHKGRL